MGRRKEGRKRETKHRRGENLSSSLCFWKIEERNGEKNLREARQKKGRTGKQIPKKGDSFLGFFKF